MSKTTSAPKEASDLAPSKAHQSALHGELRDAVIWIVIPSYKVAPQIAGVIDAIPDWVAGIVVVDDCCPEKSGEVARRATDDPRLLVVRHAHNQGVGGAVLTGYATAINAGAGIIAKADGDGQMDLSRLAALVVPIVRGKADFTKGNRFSSSSHWEAMPLLRVVGNAGLSLLSKISTGYWNLFDPTNGYNAIDARVAQLLLEKKIARRYFFESDLLYHLGTLRAMAKDIPMPALYGGEKSNLRPMAEIPRFFAGHARNTLKRFVGQYIVRDFSIASIEFVLGLALIGWGVVSGLVFLATEYSPEAPASPGMVMGVALPIIVGMQIFLSSLNFDVMNVPKEPIGPELRQLDELNMRDIPRGVRE